MRRLSADLDVAELARMVPAFGIGVVWAVLMFNSGGYHPQAWMPAGLVVVALFALAVVGSGRLLPPAGAARTALLLLLGFTGWCYVSITWSDGRGPSWEAANLLLVSVLAAWTLALVPWRTRTAQTFMVALAAVAAVACLVTLLGALDARDLTARFEDFRFSPPLDYPNTTAAFAFMAAIPALLLASRPDASVPAKALSQGLTTFLCAFALLPQSRGSILGGLAAVVILFVAVPFRWRLLAHFVLLAVCVLAVAGPVGEVYSAAANTGRASEALRDAFTAMLLAVAAAIGAGALLALAEDRMAVADEWEGVARRGAQMAGVLALLVLVAAGVVKSGSIADTASDQWQALKNPGADFTGTQANDGGNRLTSTDPLERYDYWRVSVAGFGSNPIGGMGAGGFEHRYALSRRYPKPSRYPHNVVMKVVGDTGLVGLGLITGFLIVVVRGLVLGSRRRATRERVIFATGAASLAYFLAHGMFDWLEAYPVLVGPALGFPIVALAVRGRADRVKTAAREAVRGEAPPAREERPRATPITPRTTSG